MSLHKILFLDIETVRLTEFIKDLNPHLRACFEKKFKNEIDEKVDLIIKKKAQTNIGKEIVFDATAEYEAVVQGIWVDKAGFHPEFAKICCIAVGMIGHDRTLRTRSKVGDDEKAILEWLQASIDILRRQAGGGITHICAHNGKGFDFHFIPKRCIILGLTPDIFFQIMGKKPWDLTQLLDTQEMWGMGVFNAMVALDTLAAVFGIPTPKEVMDGSEVAEYFFGHRGPDGWNLIGKYCELGDVVTLAKVYLAITSQLPLKEPDGLIQ